ncbi:MAG: hypothetical protein IRY85_13615 [Micromonosporaceae bacterium]|jgi:hypothetical protein|nr:hypothetical protein [Micromonosporaceae bacterium]
MSIMTSLARVQAYQEERAVLLVTRRHVHVSDRPLVFVPLSLAGEANAPLACLVGSTPQSPTLLVVPQPRNRDLRFRFAESLADIILGYIDTFTVSMEQDRDQNVFTDAPQLVVANPSAAAFTRLLGRSTRLRRPDGPYAVAPSVPLLGRWLTYFAEQTERPGSAAMLVMTTVLAQHWATGQSALEDLNLAALLGWIDPWDQLTGAQAAAEAEDPVRWPPAGPATDPTFDNEVLAPLIRSYDLATDDAGRARAVAALERALQGQMEPTWRLLWRAIELLRSLPAGSTVEHRWRRDRHQFTRQVEYWRDGGPPQPRRDHAVAAAQRLHWLERELDEYTVDRAFDDELVMAEFRLSGEAFVGRVTRRDPTRLDTSGRRRRLRPHIVVATTDPVRLEVGETVRSAARPSQTARIVALSTPAPADQADAGEPTDAGPIVEVTLELSGGMGRSLTPEPGSVPELGERLCYSSLVREPPRPVPFPSREQTPWTHGGPPEEYVPTDEDAGEDWS